MMNQLKPKLTLATKGDQAAIAVNKLKVILQWHAPVDLDLMAFYRAKDGRIGGVFSNNYPGGNLGSINVFPFIQLSADAGVDQQDEAHQEELIIERLSDLVELYICTLNYTDAAEQRSTAFADYDGGVTVTDNTGHSIIVPLNASQKGHVAIIAKIIQDATGKAILKNENLILTLGQFFQDIPGALLLSSSSPDPTPTTNPQPQPSTVSNSAAIARWIETVRLHAYDNPYLNKLAEKDLLHDAIAQGLTLDDARQRLLQICEKERYALASHLEWQAMQILEPCVAQKQGIDHDCFKNAADMVQQAAHGHLPARECQILVKELILAKQWPVRQGFLKGGHWFKDI